MNILASARMGPQFQGLGPNSARGIDLHLLFHRSMPWLESAETVAVSSWTEEPISSFCRGSWPLRLGPSGHRSGAWALRSAVRNSVWWRERSCGDSSFPYCSRVTRKDSELYTRGPSSFLWDHAIFYVEENIWWEHRYLLRIDWLLSSRFVGTPSRRKCSGATIGQNYPVIWVNISFGLIGGWFVDFWSFIGGAMDWWKLVKGGQLSPLLGRSGSSFSPFENDIGVVTEKWLLQVLWPDIKIWMVWVERVDGKGWHVAVGCLHAAFACCSHASTSTLQTHSYGGVWEHSHTCIILAVFESVLGSH